MNTAMAMPGNTASTWLTHLFGSGLDDDRYVVERFVAKRSPAFRRQDVVTALVGFARAYNTPAALPEVFGHSFCNLVLVQHRCNHPNPAQADRAASGRLSTEAAGRSGCGGAKMGQQLLRSAIKPMRGRCAARLEDGSQSYRLPHTSGAV